jgi:hypothetical protein
MLDDLAFDHVDHGLADVRGAVGHALEVLSEECQADCARDVARVFEHVGQQLAERLLGERVDLVVAGDDLARKDRVALDERVERLPRTISWAIRARRGMDRSAESCGLAVQLEGALATSCARSAMRSSSGAIFITPATNLRSLAAGCIFAISSRVRLSISSSSSSIVVVAADHLLGQIAVSRS